MTLVLCSWAAAISFLAVLPASIMVAIIASAIMAAAVVVVIARALSKNGYSFWLVISNPAMTLSLIMESLNNTN
jgi:hypothetical protein